MRMWSEKELKLDLSWQVAFKKYVKRHLEDNTDLKLLKVLIMPASFLWPAYCSSIQVPVIQSPACSANQRWGHLVTWPRACSGWSPGGPPRRPRCRCPPSPSSAPSRPSPSWGRAAAPAPAHAASILQSNGGGVGLDIVCLDEFHNCTDRNHWVSRWICTYKRDNTCVRPVRESVSSFFVRHTSLQKSLIRRIDSANKY